MQLATIFVAMVLWTGHAMARADQTSALPVWQAPSDAGELTVVQVWASWCASCSTILPLVHDDIKKNAAVSFETVSIDDEAEDAAGYLRKHAATFADRQLTVAIDRGASQLTALGLKTLPATIIFRGKGDKHPTILYGFKQGALEAAIKPSH